MFNPTNTWSRSPVSHRLVRGSITSNTDFITSTPTNSPNTTPTASSRIQNLLATSPTTLVKRLEEGGDVENWCTYKKLSDREKMGLIPLLLKDGAKQWFQSIAADDRDTFDKIREKFMTQYERDEIYKWRDSAAVWATVQGEKQSVEEYFTEVLRKAQRPNLSD